MSIVSMKSKGCSEKLRSVAERSQRGCLKEQFCATGILVFDFGRFISERALCSSQSQVRNHIGLDQASSLSLHCTRA